MTPLTEKLEVVPLVFLIRESLLHSHLAGFDNIDKKQLTKRIKRLVEFKKLENKPWSGVTSYYKLYILTYIL